MGCLWGALHWNPKALPALRITKPLDSGVWPQGWRQRTTVMGVINITPDSFSDGGRFLASERALAEAQRQLNNGADVLDLGAQSTRPGAEEVGEEEELRRLLPALKAIRKRNPDALISVDTFLAPVAARALEAGASWINDVSGGRHDPDLLRVVADAGCPVVLMHSRGNSQSMDQLTSYSDVVADVKGALVERSEAAIKAGVQESQIIWDPGLGFAKTHEQNLQLLRDLEQLTRGPRPVLIGPSRKRFIGAVLDEPRPKARLWGTAAVACRCAQAGAAVLRVHDVGPISQTLRMAAALW
ncbi:dihydropteroate synthase [Synechococcus sp. MU1648]|uniref:dihydropteroate synthase n=1 Tax=Synechococcus sp. MU1648 TaxID=2508351 RepID=UPI002026D7A7|nr:dihydropteroate synthase [Synechococcus sp. MU1648]